MHSHHHIAPPPHPQLGPHPPPFLHYHATLTCRYDLLEGTNELYSSGLTLEQKAHIDLVYLGADGRKAAIVRLAMTVTSATEELLRTGRVEGMEKFFYLDANLEEHPLLHNRMLFVEPVYFTIKWRLQMLTRFALRILGDEAQVPRGGLRGGGRGWEG